MKARSKVAMWALTIAGVAMLTRSRHDPATCRYCRAPAQLGELDAAVTALRAEIAMYRSQVGQIYADELAADERARTVLADREQQREGWLRELAAWERRMEALEERGRMVASQTSPKADEQTRVVYGNAARGPFSDKNEGPAR